MKRIFSLLTCVLYLTFSLGALPAYAVNESASVHAASESLTHASEPRAQSQLPEVYVSSQGAPDASGADADHPIRDLDAALTAVKNFGVVYLLDDITVPGDLVFPNKAITLDGSHTADGVHSKLVTQGNVIFQNMITFKDMEWTTAAPSADSVFINGALVELKNCALLGYPNIYMGAKDQDMDENSHSSFQIHNTSGIKTEIENLTMGGFNGHTITSSSTELQNVTIRGTISGASVLENSYVTVMEQCTIPTIDQVSRIILSDHATLYVPDHIRQVRELYGDRSTLKLNEHSTVDISYMYGEMGLEFEGNKVKPGTPIACITFIGDFFLPDPLIREGYRITSVKSDGKTLLYLDNPVKGTMKTNFKPYIKHPMALVIVQGATADLRLGVSAWDYEDGDLSTEIVYPNDDLTRLPVGQHPITYQVTDHSGNTVTSVRTVHVIPSGGPSISGAEDLELKLGQVAAFQPLEGVSATDSSGKPLTVTYEGTIGTPTPGTQEAYQLVYHATDSNNQTVSATRTITVTNYMPEIKGLDDVEIIQGDSFDFMKGVTASDYEDGEVTRIELEHPFDTQQSGQFDLVYIATDSDSNATRATRHVTIRGTVDWSEILPSTPVEPPAPPEPPMPPEPPVPPTPPTPPDPAPEPEPVPTGWQHNSAGWWYNDENGNYVTGWQQINGYWYYFASNGYMQTGWQIINGYWYYFSPSGDMQTGWQVINGYWYYFSPSGDMQTGWQMINGYWYYFSPSGDMQTGWQWINGSCYYFYPGGWMATNTWIDGSYVNGSGAWVP